jgi:hypothetical protein
MIGRQMKRAANIFALCVLLGFVGYVLYEVGGFILVNWAWYSWVANHPPAK